MHDHHTPYILPDSYLDNINSLKEDYERISGIALDDASQPYALATFFGAKDVKTRREQFRIITFFNKQLNKNLHPDLPFKTEQEILQHIDALMIMVTVSRFIIANTSQHSILRELLTKALSLNDANPLDLGTWKRCLLVTNQYLHTNGVVSTDESLQSMLISLSDYIRAESALITDSQMSSYPITATLLPLFEGPLQAAGTTTGYVIGDICGRSASLLYTPWVITATLGSGAFWTMGAATGIGMFLITPVIASQLINTLCSVSMAYIMGNIMRLAGTVIGGGSGLMLDMSWHLLSKTYTVISDSLHDTTNRADLNGLMLINAHRVVNGVEFTISEAAAEHHKLSQKPVIFTLQKDHLSIQIGEEKALIPLDLNNPCIARLYQTLQAHEESQSSSMARLT